MPSPFALTDSQTDRLLACRAAWEEGEDEEQLERLRQREEDAETLRALARLLEETRFADGQDFSRAQMARLLTLVRALAPNPNLDARLLRHPDEPAALNRDLRDLWFGPMAVPLRLRGFLARRHAGEQTATQLLCAVFPTEWPLITQAGLRALELSPEQQSAAIATARNDFALPEEVVPSDSDGVLRLLGNVVVTRAARAVLEAPDFLTVHRLLSQGLAARPSRRNRALAGALYAPSASPAPAVVRETEPPAYETPLSAPQTPEIMPAPPDTRAVSQADVLASLENEIAERGFTYPLLTVRDYYLSLQTKPFVLLSGLSGTGKTRPTSLFADALTGEDTQYRLLPVRPDWTDSAPLLGYVNLLARGGEGQFVSTPFLEFLRRAARPENAWRAYFLCLDEMNLARVEHYFAEVLSAMETPTHELLLPDGRALRLPANLFLTGTLNTDEATHSLSRKVLDRANTLTFQEVSLRDAPPAGSQTAGVGTPMELRQAVFLSARVGSVAAARERLREVGGNADFVARVLETLAEINALLEPHDLHFGYRVRDEALRYCANSFDRDGTGLLSPDAPHDAEANLATALDFQLLQKVLPRLSGTQDQLAPLLRELLQRAEATRLPRTYIRLTRLLTRLLRDGFLSFE